MSEFTKALVRDNGEEEELTLVEAAAAVGLGVLYACDSCTQEYNEEEVWGLRAAIYHVIPDKQFRGMKG